MELRITFRSEVFLQGKDMKDIAKKFQDMDFYSDEAHKKGISFVEVSSVEDSDFIDHKKEFEANI